MINKLFHPFLCFLLVSFPSLAQEKTEDEKELIKVGYAIDSTLYNGEKEYLNSIFDSQSLIQNIIYNSDKVEVKGFNEGFIQGFSKKFDFGSIILNELNEDTNYDFISYDFTDEIYYLTFRLFSDDGLNYHEYKLVKEDGKFKIADVYFYLSGEYFSDTLRNIYLQSLSGLLNEDDKEQSQLYVKELMILASVKKEMQNGDFEKAKELFEKVSEKTQLQKPFLIIAMQFSSNLDESTYAKYINLYENNYPDDPSLYLISLDGSIIKKDYKKALELIDKLDESVGGDDFLDYQRSSIYYLDNNYEQAVFHTKRLLDNYPDNVDAHVQIITLYIEFGKDEEAIDAIDIFTNYFELDKEDVKEAFETDFPEFVKKQIYKDWLNKTD